jgi:hypothetical protein
MTTIIFDHGGWTVMTSSWTAGSDDAADHVSLHYLWRSAMSPEMSAATMTLPLTVAQFITAVAAGKGPFVDLRPLQKP